MAKLYEEITEKLNEFINDQKMFFVGTAMDSGSVNISPKGMDTFRIINSNKIIWLNLTGSGNETSIHLSENERMTIMFCSFEEMPMILRLYGSARSYHRGDSDYESYIQRFPKLPGSRQIIEMDIDMVQTSCGFGVPIMDFKEERELLNKSAAKKELTGIKKYWKAKNSKSIDGYETTKFED